MDALLLQLCSPENGPRREAETQLEALRAREPDTAAVHIVQALRTSGDAAVRQQAALSLRRILMAGEKRCWPLLSEPTKQYIMSELLATIQSEHEKKVRNNTVNIISEIAAEVMDEESTPEGEAGKAWPELWQVVQGAVTAAGNNEALEMGFNLVEQLANQIAQHMQPFVPQFQALLIHTLDDGSLPAAVRQRAAMAAVAILTCLPSEEMRKSFADVLPHITMNIKAAVEAGDEDMSENLTGSFMDATDEHEPEVAECFRPYVKHTLEVLAPILANPQVHNQTRRNCLTVLYQIAQHLPSTARQMAAPGEAKGTFLRTLLPILFDFSCEWGEQDDEWLDQWETGDEETDQEEEEVDGNNMGVAMYAMGVLVQCIKPEHMRDLFLEQVQRKAAEGLANPENWPARHAAMAALGECVDFIDSDAESQVAAAQQFSKVLTSDPHPRVRAAAAMAVCNTLCMQKPDFQTNAHAHIMPALIGSLSDPSRRVRTWAARALTEYATELDDLDTRDALKPYVDEAMNAVAAALNAAGAGSTAADRSLAEASITTMAALGGAVGADASRFYADLREALLGLLSAQDPPAPTEAGTTQEQRRLRRHQEQALWHARMMKGKALECLSVLGVSSGRAVFEADARMCLGGLVGILGGIEEEKAANKAAKEMAAAVAAKSPSAAELPFPAAPVTMADNPVQSYIWQALGRLTKVLGPEDFAPFLPSLLPPLLDAAAANTTEVMTDDGLDDADLEEDDDGEEDEGVSPGHNEAVYTERGDGTVLRVRTAELEDKTNAIAALGTLFKAMNDSQRRSNGGIMGGPSPLMAHAPRLIAICEAVMKERGTPFDDIRATSVEYADEALVALASGVTAADAIAAALDIGGAAEQASAEAQAAANADAAANGRQPVIIAGVLLPEYLPPQWAASPAHVYVHSFLRLCREIADALEDEPSPDMRLIFNAHLKGLLGTACSRAAFLGEPPHHQLPANARYLPLLPANVMDTLLGHLLVAVDRSIQLRQVRSEDAKLKGAQGEIDDQEAQDMEDRNNMDLDLLKEVTNTIGTVLKTNGRPADVVAQVLPAALPRAAELGSWPVMYHKVLPVFQRWALPDAHKGDFANAVTLAVDILEFVADSAASQGVGGELMPYFLSFVAQGMAPSQHEVAKQAAAYGAGAVADRVPEAWLQHLNVVVHGLAGLIAENSGATGDKHISDTAVASLLAVLVHAYPVAAEAAASLPGFMPRADALHGVLSALPLTTDEVEMRNVAELLVDMLQVWDADLVGSAAEGVWNEDAQGRLAVCLRQFAIVLDRIEPEEGAPPDGPHSPEAAMRATIMGCLAGLQSTGHVPDQIMQVCMAKLSPEDAQALEHAGYHMQATATGSPVASPGRATPGSSPYA